MVRVPLLPGEAQAPRLLATMRAKSDAAACVEKDNLKPVNYATIIVIVDGVHQAAEATGAVGHSFQQTKEQEMQQIS